MSLREMTVRLCKSGAVAAVAEAPQFAAVQFGVAQFGVVHGVLQFEAVPFVAGERWFEGEQS